MAVAVDVALALASCLTCLASLSIILTYALFADLRKLRFLEMVFYVSVNDFIAGLSVGLFSLFTGEVQCFIQGFTTGYNYLVAAFWTVVITYQLFVAVQTGKIIQDLYVFHWICWVIPLIVTLLVLTTNTFGRYGDDDSTVTWCFVGNTRRSFPNSILFWELMSFYIWLWLSILLMFIIVIFVNKKVRSMTTVSEVIRSSLQKLYFYPVIFIFSWTLPSIADTYAVVNNGKHVNKWVGLLSDFLPVLQGVPLAVVFFTRNPIVRETWLAYLSKYAKFGRYLWNNWCCCKSSDQSNVGMPEFSWSENDDKIRVILGKIDNESDYVDRSSNSRGSLAGAYEVFRESLAGVQADMSSSRPKDSVVDVTIDEVRQSDTTSRSRSSFLDKFSSFQLSSAYFSSNNSSVTSQGGSCASPIHDTRELEFSSSTSSLHRPLC